MDRLIIIIALFAGLGVVRIMLNDHIQKAKNWLDIYAGKGLTVVSGWIESLFRVDIDEDRF